MHVQLASAADTSNFGRYSTYIDECIQPHQTTISDSLDQLIAMHTRTSGNWTCRGQSPGASRHHCKRSLKLTSAHERDRASTLATHPRYPGLSSCEASTTSCTSQCAVTGIKGWPKYSVRMYLTFILLNTLTTL
jgi:hypothetical protein